MMHRPDAGRAPPLLAQAPGVTEVARACGTLIVLLNKLEQPLVPLYEMPLRLTRLRAIVRQ